MTTGTTLVKKGTWIKVTGHLAKWHTNRALSIYARVPGGHNVLIKRGKVNYKAMLAVPFRVRRKTVFTVYHGGDSWYLRARAYHTVNIK